MCLHGMRAPTYRMKQALWEIIMFGNSPYGQIEFEMMAELDRSSNDHATRLQATVPAPAQPRASVWQTLKRWRASLITGERHLLATPNDDVCVANC